MVVQAMTGHHHCQILKFARYFHTDIVSQLLKSNQHPFSVQIQSPFAVLETKSLQAGGFQLLDIYHVEV